MRSFISLSSLAPHNGGIATNLFKFVLLLCGILFLIPSFLFMEGSGGVTRRNCFSVLGNIFELVLIACATAAAVSFISRYSPKRTLLLENKICKHRFRFLTMGETPEYL